MITLTQTYVNHPTHNSLPFLVKKIREQQLDDVLDKLCKFLVTDKDKMRDVAR